jgi:hypothetical protein
VCKTQDDYNYLRCLRAHGWTRHLTTTADVEAAHPTINPRFLFVSVGYNLRPLEVQGTMLSVQLTKLHAFNECRRENMARIQAALTCDARFAVVMALARAAPGTDPAWFGIAAMLHRPYAHQLQAFLAYLSGHGIENRPIISGNFVRQPAIAAYCPQARPEDFLGAEAVHMRGFFIGVHQVRIEEAVITKLVEVMLAFKFKPRKMVLVTGSGGMLGRHIQDVVTRAPLVNALVARAVVAVATGSTSPLQVMGTGNPERQIMHAADLARACMRALFHYDDGEALIVVGEEVSARHLADLVCQATAFTGGRAFDKGAVENF